MGGSDRITCLPSFPGVKADSALPQGLFKVGNEELTRKYASPLKMGKANKVSLLCSCGIRTHQPDGTCVICKMQLRKITDELKAKRLIKARGQNGKKKKGD
jgi:hypothetical protein